MRRKIIYFRLSLKSISRELAKQRLIHSNWMLIMDLVMKNCNILSTNPTLGRLLSKVTFIHFNIVILIDGVKIFKRLNVFKTHIGSHSCIKK